MLSMTSRASRTSRVSKPRSADDCPDAAASSNISNGEKKLMYWLMGAMLGLIMAGLAFHMSQTARAIEGVNERIDKILYEMKHH